ncbi:multicomponent K+:H+ antiporter subunit E [Crenobacter luteus]|uniref:Na+/H+ antiporter subunit E n=1 Tax=Crenobacter luteus TaxID=1452487 RepID=UPI0010E49679|nr:Na+/H+ antiporter subunit E [Crenobacter luteus]TCP13028.1 multicomponent K+:H+ antiporter subunit E [Crenobacter luteus]
MTKPQAALVLACRFLVAVSLSGVQTSWLILFRAARLRPGFVDYRCAPLSETGMVVLACLVTLTPGTTAVELDAAGGRLRLHLLDTGDVAGTLDGIRRRFEAPLRRLWGRR